MTYSPKPTHTHSRIPIQRPNALDVNVFVYASTTNSIYTSMFDTIHGGYSYNCVAWDMLFYLTVCDDRDFMTLRWIP